MLFIIIALDGCNNAMPRKQHKRLFCNAKNGNELFHDCIYHKYTRFRIGKYPIARPHCTGKHYDPAFEKLTIFLTFSIIFIE